MSIFSELKSQVLLNLADVGSVHYSSDDLRDSFQDGYDDIIALTQCLVKKVTLPFTTLPYYDFAASGVPDFLAVVAIYNNVTNTWLLDNVTLRSFDLMRDDWELWKGAPQWWAAANYRYTAIIPSYSASPGTMDLYYWAAAPTVSDGETPLLPTDLQKLLEFYVTPDLLEQSEEFTKASIYWKTYYELVEVCKDRIRNQARADLYRLA